MKEVVAKLPVGPGCLVDSVIVANVQVMENNPKTEFFVCGVCSQPFAADEYVYIVALLGKYDGQYQFVHPHCGKIDAAT